MNNREQVEIKRNFKNPIKPKQIIIGSSSSKEGLKCAEKKKWIFISRCDKNTDVNNVVSYLTEGGIKDTICEQIKTKYNYNSFKVSVLERDFNTILQEDFWPKGIIVKEFEPPRSVYRPRRWNNVAGHRPDAVFLGTSQ